MGIGLYKDVRNYFRATPTWAEGREQTGGLSGKGRNYEKGQLLVLKLNSLFVSFSSSDTV